MVIDITFSRAEISVLKHLNSNEQFRNQDGDRAFVNWLLKKLCSSDELVSHKNMNMSNPSNDITSKKLSFIRDLLAIRVKDDKVRLAKFDELIDKFSKKSTLKNKN